MPRPDFKQLERELIHTGVSPANIRRTLVELNEHFDDLVDAELDAGRNVPAAEDVACARLGDLRGVVHAVNERPELKSWAWRWPRLALFVYPLACVAALPAVPVIAGVQNASMLARWATCLLVGGLVTASIFLVLQLSITLT